MLRVAMNNESWEAIFEASKFFTPEYGHAAALVPHEEGTSVCNQPHIAYFHGDPADTPMRAFLYYEETSQRLVIESTGLHNGSSEDVTVYWDFLKELFDPYIVKPETSPEEEAENL